MLNSWRIFKVVLLTAILAHNANAKTYRQVVMAKDSTEAKTALGASCLKAIQVYFRSGKTFERKEIQDFTKTISEFSFRSGNNDAIFYHYTKSPELKKFAEDGDMSKEFDYLRSSGSYGPFYFVAEDSKTSRSFGPIQTVVVLNPESRIVIIDYETVIANARTTFPKSVNKACSGEGYFFDMLVLEENQVALINYTGHGSWFELISEKEVKSFSLGESN